MEKILTNGSAVVKIYQIFPHQSFALYSNSSVHILPRDEYFCQVRLEQSYMLYQEMNSYSLQITFVE